MSTKTNEQKNNPTIENHFSEIDVVYKRNVRYADLPKINCSDDAYKYLKGIWSDNMDHIEEFVVLFLNRGNKVIGYSRISKGGTSGTIVDPKVIYQIALKANVSGMILAHNHPSGNTNPSQSDISLTKKLIKAGDMLDITILDHLILTSEGYTSMADEGMM